MAGLYAFNMVTLDGLFEGPTPWSIDWHNAANEEFGDFAVDQLNGIGTILFGRKTYEGMASYWPTPAALEADPAVAEAMNRLPKVVFSRTLETADWSNSRLVRDDIAGEITRLKQQPGKDLALFGSANLLSTLVKLGLVDEHRLMVNPIVLGRGTPLFQGVDQPLKLELIEARPFKSGNVLLRYRPA
jgi:dihydrofolate reductase